MYDFINLCFCSKWEGWIEFLIVVFTQILLKHKGDVCDSPSEMAEEVISYLETKGFLEA